MTKPEFLRNGRRRLLTPEQVLLGLMLKGPVIDWNVRPEHFSVEAHRTICQHILDECEGAGRHVPPEVIGERLKRSVSVRELGGAQYLETLLQAEGDLAFYAEEVQTEWLQRQAKRLKDGEGHTDDQDWIDAEAARIREAYPRRADGLAASIFSAADFSSREVPPRTWQVRGMVPSKAVTLLQGDGGSGKSTLALQLLAATVLGRTWLGQEVRQGGAIYFSCEDDRDEVHRRLDSIAVDLGVGFSALADLKVLDMTGRDAVLASADRSGILAMSERWSELEELVRAHRPVLVVIDNLADVYAGDENARAQVRAFISRLQACAAEIDAAMILIGHPSLAGMATGTGSSGSTAWNNSVRSRLYLTRPQGDDAEAFGPDVRVLTVKKANYGTTAIEIRLRWSAGVFVADADEGVTLDLVAGQAKADRKFLELLDTYQGQGRSVSDKPGANYAPTVFSKDPLAAGFTKSGLTMAMNRLFTAGALRVDMVGRPSRQLRQIVRATASDPDDGESDA